MKARRGGEGCGITAVRRFGRNDSGPGPDSGDDDEVGERDHRANTTGI